ATPTKCRCATPCARCSRRQNRRRRRRATPSSNRGRGNPSHIFFCLRRKEAKPNDTQSRLDKASGPLLCEILPAPSPVGETGTPIRRRRFQDLPLCNQILI